MYPALFTFLLLVHGGVFFRFDGDLNEIADVRFKSPSMNVAELSLADHVVHVHARSEVGGDEKEKSEC